uniref:Uncharacterized protein n=1 Tax=Pristionchus pacificus TaxID=54126 RepID=A0A2A6C3E2_PRIPA|eukprot:PDM72695.1 hypothetical protein PRIPAC_39129 [Pristionchus pacificus]
MRIGYIMNGESLKTVEFNFTKWCASSITERMKSEGRKGECDNQESVNNEYCVLIRITVRFHEFGKAKKIAIYVGESLQIFVVNITCNWGGQF